MSVINTNMASLNAQHNLQKSSADLQTSIQRLSSGLRVNTAKDDAAGFGIAASLDAKIRGENVAIRNANDGISYSQTAEGALSNISNNLQRMRELAVQAASGSYSSTDRANLDTEFQQLNQEITRIVKSTSFNGVNVMTGSATVSFQVGSGTAAENQITFAPVDFNNMASVTNATLNINSSTFGITGSDVTASLNALGVIDTALTEVNQKMVKQGAYQNRFTAVISTLSTSVENNSSARSRIVDADYATETSKLARNQVLQQAGMAMLAQANQLPNNVLSLLR